MTLTIDFWQLVGLLVTGLGALWGVVKAAAAQAQAGRDAGLAHQALIAGSGSRAAAPARGAEPAGPTQQSRPEGLPQDGFVALGNGRSGVAQTQGGRPGRGAQMTIKPIKPIKPIKRSMPGRSTRWPGPARR